MHHVRADGNRKHPSRVTEELKEMAETCVMMRTRLVARAVSSIYDEKLRPFGLNASQCSLLVVIFGLGPSRRADIGRFNRLDRSTLSRNLQIMLVNGWIEEVDDEKNADGRGRPVTLSTAGRDLLHAAFPAWREAQIEATGVLGREGASVVSQIGNDLMGYGSGQH